MKHILLLILMLTNPSSYETQKYNEVTTCLLYTSDAADE